MSQSPLLRLQPSPRLVALVLALLTLAVYWPVTQYGFVQLDDDVAIVNNPHIRDGLTWQAVKWAFTTTYYDYWHPLPWLTHMLDISLYGMNPGGFHLTNLVLHTANVMLLFAVLFGMTRRLWESALVGALFALHPMHVESVAWIVERKDVLGALFWFACMALYAWYAARPGWRRYAALVGCYALGLMCKPMLVTLPLALLLLDFWPLKRLRLAGGNPPSVGCGTLGPKSLAALSVEKVPLLIMALASAVATLLTVHSTHGTFTLADLSMPVRLANTGIAYVAYLDKLVWPAGLAVYYPYQFEPAYSATATALAILSAMTIAALGVSSVRPYVAVGWLWFLLTLSPVIGIVQTGTQAMADRFAYVPFVGLYVAAVWGTAEMAGRLRVRPVVVLASGLALLLCLAALTTRQLRYWRDSQTLFRHTLAVTRDNWFINNNLGVYLLQHNRPADAAVALRASLALAPTYAEAMLNLGTALARMGRPDSAVACYQQALRLDPGFARAHHALAIALQQRGDDSAAESEYLAALRCNPSLWEAHSNLGLLYDQLDEPSLAEGHLREALAIAPHSPLVLYNLGLHLARNCRADSAVRVFSLALAEQPRNKLARLERGIAYEMLGQLEPAVVDLRLTVSEMPNEGRAHGYLGLSLRRLGQADSSRYHLTEAVRLGFDTISMSFQHLSPTSDSCR